MKKFILSALSLALLSSILFCNQSALASDNSKSEMYKAYMYFIEDRLDAVGYIQPSTIDDGKLFSKSPGVVYAELIDFDGDGQEELYMLEFIKNESIPGDYYFALTWLVYTYQGGAVTLSKSGEHSTITFDFGVTQGKSGKIYVYNSFEGWHDGEAWEFANGEWHHTEIRSNFIPSYSSSWNVNGQHIHISSDTGSYTWDVIRDGVTILSNSDEMPSQLIAEIEGEVRKPFDHHQNRPADGTPQALVQRLEAEAVPLYRIPSEWAKPSVEQLAAANAVPARLQKGYQRPITRGDFCSLAVPYYENATGSVIRKQATFSDTDDINIQKMAGLGVVNGIGNNCFDPNAPLTREQAATILARLAEAIDNPFPENRPTFTDTSTISSWAQDAVGQLQSSGIMGGVGNNQFDPKSPYTREQSIVTIKRMETQIVPCEKIELELDGRSLQEHDAELLPVAQHREIKAKILPENTTNKSFVWSSSEETLVMVRGGLVRGVSPGKARITATAVNGVSTSIDFNICDYVITPKGPIELNCVAHPNKQYKPTADYVPDELLYAGSIQLNEYTNYAASNNRAVMVKGKITKTSDDVKYFIPYVKWVVKDQAGKIIDSGLAYSLAGGDNVGDDLQFPIHLGDYTSVCTIEFYGDDGFTEAQLAQNATMSAEKNVPTIELPRLPFTQSTSVLVDALEIERDTLSVQEIRYAVSDYDRKRDCYKIEFTCSGTVHYPYIDSHMAPNSVSWKLFDASGAYVSSGSFRAPEFDYESSSGERSFQFSGENMGTVQGLKPNEKYTLVIGGRRDNLVAP